MNDPIKHCPVYKDHGCAHVDGYLCDYPNCSMMSDYWFAQYRRDYSKYIAEAIRERRVFSLRKT